MADPDSVPVELKDLSELKKRNEELEEEVKDIVSVTEDAKKLKQKLEGLYEAIKKKKEEGDLRPSQTQLDNAAKESDEHKKKVEELEKSIEEKNKELEFLKKSNEEFEAKISENLKQEERMQKIAVEATNLRTKL